MTQAQLKQLSVMRQASELKSRQLEIQGAAGRTNHARNCERNKPHLEAKALKAEVGLRSAIDAVGAEQAWAGAKAAKTPRGGRSSSGPTSVTTLGPRSRAVRLEALRKN